MGLRFNFKQFEMTKKKRVNYDFLLDDDFSIQIYVLIEKTTRKTTRKTRTCLRFRHIEWVWRVGLPSYSSISKVNNVMVDNKKSKQKKVFFFSFWRNLKSFLKRIIIIVRERVGQKRTISSFVVLVATESSFLILFYSLIGTTFVCFDCFLLFCENKIQFQLVFFFSLVVRITREMS